MRYNHTAKSYKIVDAKVNKKLINDEIKLEAISSRKPPILQQILQRLDKMDKRFDKIESTLNSIIKLNSLKH